MRKILVIGSGGAGKSTFARRLGALLKLEVIHLDRHYWQPGWIETPKDLWAERVAELIRRDAWVMDGNYSGTFDLRFAACDTIIFLDVPRLVCMWRVLKRALLYRKRRRPDMAEGCPEMLNLEFLLWIWNYPRRSRPKVLEMLAAHAREKTTVTLRTKTEVAQFLASANKTVTSDK